MKDTLNLIKETLVDLCVPQTADGGPDAINGDGLDMAGFEGVLFVAVLGVVTGAGVDALTAQASDDDGGSDSYGDLAGTSTSKVTGSNKLLALNVHRPAKRYIRPVLTRSVAASIIGGVIAIRYGARKSPTTQGADVATQVSVISPAEGTP